MATTQTCHIWIGAGTNSTSGTAYSTNPAWTVPSNITTSSTVNITIKSGSAGGYLTPSGGSGQQASDYYLCDSAGNNAVFIQTFTAQTTTNNNPKTVNLRGLAGKVLYLKEVKTSNGNTYNGGIHIRGDCYFTVTYDTYGACTAPTSVTLAQQSNGVLRVSWSGAAGGANNSIASYYVYLSTSSGGGVSGSLSATVTTTATSGTKDFTVNNTTTYYAAVRTQGSAGSSYYSGYKWSAGKAAYYYTACGAPTSVSLAQQANGVLRASWSGAKGGTNNAISSYYVYLSTSSGGGVSGSLSATVSTTATSGTKDFTVNNTTTYYAAVRTQGAAGSSYYSGYKWSGGKAAYYYTSPSTPGGVTLAQAGNGKLKASWNASTNGTNNAVAGYHVILTTSSSGTTASFSGDTNTSTREYTFTVNNTTTYYARVYAKGTNTSYNSGWGTSGAKAAYYYTACGAPSNVAMTRTRGTVSITWSAGSNGTNNAISNYGVIRNTSKSETNATSVSTGGSSGLTNAPGTGTYYYAVRTQGAAGATYYSGYVWSTNSITVPSKPTVAAGDVITDTQMNTLKNWINSNNINTVSDGALAQASDGNTYRSGLTANTSKIQASWYNSAADG